MLCLHSTYIYHFQTTQFVESQFVFLNRSILCTIYLWIKVVMIFPKAMTAFFMTTNRHSVEENQLMVSRLGKAQYCPSQYSKL